MEDRKKIGWLIVGVSCLVLAIIVIMLLKNNSSKISGNQATTTPVGTNLPSSGTVTMPTSTPGSKIRNYQKYNVSQEKPHALDSTDAAVLSESFAERLGSFSNQSDYSNFTDLKIMMTDNMKAWIDKYVTGLKKEPYSGQYYGITTHTLTSKVVSDDEKSGKAKVEVMTERQEQQATALKPSYKQKLTVELIKTNGQWLVDSAFWEKK
jgi:hypothetical protein